MNNILLVFFGGGLGSVVRYFIGIVIHRNVSSIVPWHTFAANIIAAAILGFLSAWMLLKPGPYETQRLLLGVGFCGGLSTFSTFTLENFELIKNGNWVVAVLYMLLSLIACLIAFWAAWQIQK